MTKIILVSDSHGLEQELVDIYEHFKDETTHFIHCGDSQLKKEHPLLNIYQSVKGNCDRNLFPKEIILTIDNKKLLITHGHHFHVKFNLNRLYFYALEKGVDIVCFGHSHSPLVVNHDNMVIVNPGSVAANRRMKETTFAVITFNDGNVQVKHYNVESFHEIDKKTT